MQINRLFEIIYILLSKKCVTAKELADHFEVSSRTVYRDVETLSQAGIPIYTNKGRGGGISLVENFVLNKSVLSQQEQQEILSALQGLNATNYPGTDSIMGKLSSLFGSVQDNWIEVDFSDWNAGSKQMFEKLKNATIHQQVISFDYYSSAGEKTHRTAEPLQLWFKYKCWYLKAFCQFRQEERVFKLSRIKNLELLNETFDRSIRSSKEEPEMIHDMEEDGEPVTLWIDSSQAYRVYDEFQEEQITCNPDGSYLIHARYPDQEWAYSYIFSYGCSIQVLEPEWMRLGLQKRLKELSDYYFRDPNSGPPL